MDPMMMMGALALLMKSNGDNDSSGKGRGRKRRSRGRREDERPRKRKRKRKRKPSEEERRSSRDKNKRRGIRAAEELHAYIEDGGSYGTEEKPSRTVERLQEAMRLRPDGILGPKTATRARALGHRIPPPTELVDKVPDGAIEAGQERPEPEDERDAARASDNPAVRATVRALDNQDAAE